MASKRRNMFQKNKTQETTENAMEVSKDWLESVLKNHSKETSVDEIICLETEPAVGKGECYSSQIVRVKLKILYASGKTANRSVLYKKLPDNEDLRQFLTEYNAFPAEIDTFSDIIPRMDELMSEHGDTNEKLWCDCLWFNRYDQLVLQDLKEMGYRNLARQSGMNVEHGVVTLNALGRLHGMSAILLQKKRIHPGLLKPYPMGRNDPTSNHLLSLGCSILAQVIKENWGSEWETAARKISTLSVDIGPRLQRLCATPGDNLIVYNHGDCWINNIMFKYGTWSDSPIGVRFVDFQECHFNSFGWDLSLFFMSSMSPEDVYDNYDTLLTAYRSSLVKTLEFYGLEADLAPTLDQIKAELKRLAPYPLALAAHFLPVLLAEPQDSMDGNYVLSENDDAAFEQKKRGYTAKKYTQIMKIIVPKYLENISC